jgi:signal transduction histidine kinase/DNA-binding response OmpR family regulator
MPGERILLVEDSAQMRSFLANDVLSPAGYDVLTATDGDEGLTLARDLEPDLVIADYQMPGHNGLEMLLALRQEEIYLPYILITAEGSEELAVQALRLDVSDYLIKPFDPDDLLSAVARTLREHWTQKIAHNVQVQLLQTNRMLEQRLRELDTLVGIGKRVTGQLDLQTVLNQVVEAAVALTHAEEGSLLLVDQPSGELYLYVSTRTNFSVTDTLRLPVADSLAGQVVQTGEPLIIHEARPQKIVTNYLFRDLVYLPLRAKGEVIGVLGISNHEQSGEFDPHVIKLLSLVADFAAIAIENARLYTETEHERSTLDAILRDTEDAIIVVDTADRILFCNPAARRTFSLPHPACLGNRLQSVIQHQELAELFAKQARSGRSRSSEIRLDDGQRVLNAQLTIVAGVGRVVVMQDITHLKELDRIKSDFVTAVSHDLRSPLTTILGYVELVRRSGPLNPAQEEFTDRICLSVNSITVLISELLELGKIEAGFDQDREPVSLASIVTEAVEDHRHEWETKAQTLLVNVPERLPPVLGIPLRLRQVVNNLLENAIKYTPKQGQVTVALAPDDDLLVMRVSDTGIGIPQKDQPYIFDKFYRTDEAIDRFQGTGLGLSIVKSIVEQHQGRIWVESQPGEGSTFTVVLPTYDPDA